MALKEADDGLEAYEAVISKLEEFGIDRADLPGPGDLKDAVEQAGFVLAQET